MKGSIKLIVFFVFFLIFLNFSYAQEIKVVKESPKVIGINDIIEIKIHILNPYPDEKEFLIEEILSQDVEVVEPSQFSVRKNDALDIKYYDWVVKISPGLIKTITYKLRPIALGEYSIGPTQVTDKSNFRVYESDIITFRVSCIPNNVCEGGENGLNCPEDCVNEASDGICNYKADGICDLDCDVEPDCKKFDFNLFYLIIPFILVLIVVLVLMSKKLFKKKENFAVKEEDKKIKYFEYPTKNEKYGKDPLEGFENNQ